MENEEFSVRNELNEDVVDEMEERIESIRHMNQIYEYNQVIRIVQEQSDRTIQTLVDLSIILSVTFLVFIVWAHWATRVFLVVNGLYLLYAVAKLGVMYWFIKRQRKKVNKLIEIEGEDYHDYNYTD